MRSKYNLATSKVCNYSEPFASTVTVPTSIEADTTISYTTVTKSGETVTDKVNTGSKRLTGPKGKEK